jgi:hypothetical protein
MAGAMGSDRGKGAYAQKEEEEEEEKKKKKKNRDGGFLLSFSHCERA